MNEDSKERRKAEIALLEAMYPEQVIWAPKSGELKYNTAEGAILVLRLPDSYPVSGLPEIVTAVNADKHDMRHVTTHIIHDCATEGLECLDAVLVAFNDRAKSFDTTEESPTLKSQESEGKVRYKTTIVWLHHLLALTKRKLALNPSSLAKEVSGVTKPGYPGVLLFSGAAGAVDAHVAELKDQRWQAFQVRFEEEVRSPWEFVHGNYIKEMETMSEVVQGIQNEDNRNAFLKAVGVK